MLLFGNILLAYGWSDMLIRCLRNRTSLRGVTNLSTSANASFLHIQNIYILLSICPNWVRDIEAFTVCYVVGGLPQPAGLSAAGPLVQSVAPRAAACHMAA